MRIRTHRQVNQTIPRACCALFSLPLLFACSSGSGEFLRDEMAGTDAVSGDDDLGEEPSDTPGDPLSGCRVEHLKHQIEQSSFAIWSYEWMFDSNGHMTEERFDEGLDGVDRISRWTRHEGLLVERSDDTDADGDTDVITTYAYDESGALITEEQVIDDSVVFRRSHSWSGKGHHLRVESDNHADGSIDSWMEWGYASGAPPHLPSHQDDSSTGGSAPEWRTYFFYSEEGYVLAEELDEEVDGTIDWFWLYEVDAQGRETRKEAWIGGTDAPNEIANWEYDSMGSVVYFEETNGAGEGKERWAYVHEYDENARRLRTDHDVSADGSIDGWETWTYICDR